MLDATAHASCLIGLGNSPERTFVLLHEDTR